MQWLKRLLGGDDVPRPGGREGVEAGAGTPRVDLPELRPFFVAMLAAG
jgi:hypothetical protein